MQMATVNAAFAAKAVQSLNIGHDKPRPSKDAALL